MEEGGWGVEKTETIGDLRNEDRFDELDDSVGGGAGVSVGDAADVE